MSRRWDGGGEGFWGPYVSVAERRRRAAAEAARVGKKSGRTLAPVKVDGRAIASTFWGKAWCTNLEAYSDYATRLPRGRSYLRHGAVVDLQLAPGKITALVSGTELYTVAITVQPVAPARWSGVIAECAGQVGSLVALLKGQLSAAVMAVITRKGTGLFPAPGEIKLACSCPDPAKMCKHIAAVLYGVGARLDAEPALLFALRQVDQRELVARAATAGAFASAPAATARVLDESSLESVFGIELAGETPAAKRRAGADGAAGKSKGAGTGKKSSTSTGTSTGTRKSKGKG
jgi:uncharacterized Zn finger protein